MVMFFLLRARESATYNIPWVNEGEHKCKPMRVNVWPCALLMVMAKHGFTGNWILLNANGRSVSVGIMAILGIILVFPFDCPSSSSTSMTLARSLATTQRVPFVSSGGSRERIKIIGHPTLRMQRWDGIAESSIESRNSWG